MGVRMRGALLFQRAGLFADRRFVAGDADEAWNTLLEGRDTLSWHKGRHSLKFGGSYRWLIWPMWALVQSRGYYSFTSGFTTQTATNDGTGSRAGQFAAGHACVAASAERTAHHGPASMVRRCIRAGHVAGDRAHDRSKRACATNTGRRWWTASRQWSNLIDEERQADGIYRRPTRYAPRLNVPEQAALRAPHRSGASL